MVTAQRDKLGTRDLMGVEILAPGTWNGDPYTGADLDAIVSAFTELPQIRPPFKLGHDKSQKLAQNDGYPAIGWVTNVRRNGDKLLADILKIPAQLADIIQAGGYDSISSEIYFDLDVAGKVYPRVLRAVAALGGDLPAVKDIKSISDVAALYADLFKGAEARYAEYAASEKPAPPEEEPEGTEDDDAEMAEDDMQSLLSAHDAYYAQVTKIIAGKPGAKRVRTYLGTARRELAGMKTPFKANKESDMETKKLAEMLGLPATATEAEIEARIAENKTKAEAEPKPKEGADLSEVRELQNKVGTLTKELAERQATEAVELAQRAGKIAPAQLEWAKAYAISDPAGFKAYAEAAPKLAVLTPTGGHELDGGDAEGAPSETAKSIARQVGLSEASLARAASGKPTSEIAREMAAAASK